MFPASLLLLLLAAASCIYCDITLTQPGSMVVRPEESVTIPCKVTGYSVTSTCTNWIRHSEGKAMEWIGYLCSSSSSGTTDSLKSKISFTVDSSSSTVFLQGKNFQTEDTAVYYCARNIWGLGRFDYWGKGTQVTVSTATTAPSSLLTLMNCGTPSNDIYSIGCVAKGFSPSSHTFKWTDDSGKALTDFVQYPAVQSGGTYTGVSQLRVAKNVWEISKSFNCSVDHAGVVKTAVINRPISNPPTVSLLSAPIGTTQYLMCIIEDFIPNKVTVTWKKNDKEVEGPTPTVGLQLSGLYSGSSLLKVTNTDWNNKVKYSCLVQHQRETINKTISKTEPLTVTLNPPSVKKVFIDNQAVMDCVISGTDQDTVSGTTITWHVNGRKQTDHIDLKPIESKGKLNSRVSTLTINQTEWTKVNKVQCSAMKRGEDTPVIQDLSFTKGSEAPSVFVHLLPEEDTKKEGEVTLVCLVACPSLCDVYIMWQVDSGQYQEGVTSPPQKNQKGNYSVTSVFTTTKDKWDTNLMFTCAVKHAGLDNNTALKERSVSKSLGNSCEDK